MHKNSNEKKIGEGGEGEERGEEGRFYPTVMVEMFCVSYWQVHVYLAKRLLVE